MLNQIKGKIERQITAYGAIIGAQNSSYKYIDHNSHKLESSGRELFFIAKSILLTWNRYL